MVKQLSFKPVPDSIVGFTTLVVFGGSTAQAQRHLVERLALLSGQLGGQPGGARGRQFLQQRGVDPKRTFVESRIDQKIKEPRLDIQLLGRPSSN